jgi:hypothetical protein
MEFFDDTVAAKPLIEKTIQKYGYAPEHNYYWYQYYQYYYNPPQKNIFVTTDRGALMTAYNGHDDEYFVVFDPLAPFEHRASLLVEYITWVFSNTTAQKIWFQLDRSVRPELLRTLPHPYRSCRIYYTMVWPITDLRTFDSELQGGHYKTLRKEIHKFYREHKVSVCDAKTYKDRDGLRAILEHWKKNKPNHERGMTGVYHKVIDERFEGFDEARVFMVDGKAVGINGGWMIPNSDRFYGAVGLHDYSVDDLGAALYLEDLIWLKNRGYHEADMGGSEKSLLAFKNKFLPGSFYKNDVFSIVKQ